MATTKTALFLHGLARRTLICLALFALGGCGSDDTTPSAGDRSRQHIATLSETLGKRVAGSDNDLKSRGYIADEFRRLGYQVTLQPFSFSRDKKTIETANVIAVLHGSGSGELVVGAHYDSVPEGAGTGASDNASGVGVMLAVARELRSAVLPYTVKFIAFGAEEDGLFGSEYHVSQLSGEEISRTLGMINLDTVIGGDKIYVYGSWGTDGWMRDQALAFAASRGIPLETNPGLNPLYPAGTAGDWSDHALFKEQGIPYAYFEATNWDIGNLDGWQQTEKYGEIYHTDRDTLAFLDSAFPGRIDFQLQAVTAVLRDLIVNLNPPPGASEAAAARTKVPIRKTTRDGVPLDKRR